MQTLDCVIAQQVRNITQGYVFSCCEWHLN
jgi:hypothetical protein